MTATPSTPDGTPTIIPFPDSHGARCHTQSRAQASALDELDQWDDQITALNLALTDAALAREQITNATAAMEIIEAQAVLEASGSNAETRKASVTLALAAHAAYQDLAVTLREQRLRLADADRHITVCKERCRLLRAAVSVVLDSPDAA